MAKSQQAVQGEVSDFRRVRSEKKHFIIDVRSSPLHTVSNGFSKGLKSIYEVDLDQFAVDLHSFFSSQLKKSKNILM